MLRESGKERLSCYSLAAHESKADKNWDAFIVEKPIIIAKLDPELRNLA